jgi:hypothetical protein
MEIIKLPKELYFNIIYYLSNVDLISLCKIPYFRQLILNDFKLLLYISFPSIGDDIILFNLEYRNILYILDFYINFRSAYNNAYKFLSKIYTDRPWKSWRFFNFDIKNYAKIYEFIQSFADKENKDILDIYSPTRVYQLELYYYFDNKRFELHISHQGQIILSLPMIYKDAINLLIHIKYYNVDT